MVDLCVTENNHYILRPVLPNILFRRLCMHRFSPNFITRRRFVQGRRHGWTGMDMPTPLLPEVVSEIDANPVSFYFGRGGGV